MPASPREVYFADWDASEDDDLVCDSLKQVSDSARATSVVGWAEWPRYASSHSCTDVSTDP